MATDYKEVRQKRGVLGKIAVLTGAALFGAGSPASAQDQLPEYDVDAYCEQVAQTSGGSYMIEKGCRDQERAARRWLQKTQVSAKISDYCDQVASTTGGSYVIFKGCVQQERRARDAMQ